MEGKGKREEQEAASLIPEGGKEEEQKGGKTGTEERTIKIHVVKTLPSASFCTIPLSSAFLLLLLYKPFPVMVDGLSKERDAACSRPSMSPPQRRWVADGTRT